MVCETLHFEKKVVQAKNITENQCFNEIWQSHFSLPYLTLTKRFTNFYRILWPAVGVQWFSRQFCIIIPGIIRSKCMSISKCGKNFAGD